MKIAVVAAISLVSLIYLNRRRLRVFTNDGLRIYLGVAAIAIIAALSFGPPEYIVFKPGGRMAEINGNMKEVYPGWQLNRLLPMESFATPVLYGARWGDIYPATEADKAVLQGAFQVPGSPVSRFIWIILILGIVAADMVIRFLRRILEARQALASARTRDTINAYNSFIQRYRKGFFRPRSLLRKAENGRSDVYERYVRRTIALKAINERQVQFTEQTLENSNLTATEQREYKILLEQRRGYSRVLKLLGEVLAHNRLKGATSLPFQLDVSSGIYSDDFTQQYDTPLVLLEATRDDLEQKLERTMRLLGLPEFPAILEQHRDQAAAAKAGLARHSWAEYSQLASSIRHQIETGAQSSLLEPSEVKNLQSIATMYAQQYLFVKLTCGLPVNREFRQYQQRCAVAVENLLLDVFNRFIPDEQDDQGELAMFRDWSPTEKSVLRVDLAYTGSAFTSGLIPCKARFTFIMDDQLVCERAGRPASADENIDIKKRPLVDMLYNCAIAFSPPPAPRSENSVSPPQSETALRVLLEKLDDEINEHAKDMARDELENALYEQLPDELQETVIAVNQYIERQLDQMTDEAIEMAGTLLDLILNSGAGDE
ncbi:hypothetical protein SAMN05216203_0178 [Marinobacter daqiaonensis]|uniref:Uncharacterized protein n=1 Tax=Marinobacter daqiaonensis TaxID=650891 RepID=A0A1I6GJM6_9GAMM|nr:hypothetical protein [Marinobacter daqiaonensis]SFR42404.1 hypothetical protein SAMN05216203_0178 [Marinobacter daqiaonensis]